MKTYITEIRFKNYKIIYKLVKSMDEDSVHDLVLDYYRNNKDFYCCIVLGFAENEIIE